MMNTIHTFPVSLVCSGMYVLSVLRMYGSLVCATGMILCGSGVADVESTEVPVQSTTTFKALVRATENVLSSEREQQKNTARKQCLGGIRVHATGSV